MQIAVTGGNGDLGRSLVPYLLEQGHTVISIDRVMPMRGTHPHSPDLRHQIADVRDIGDLVGSLRGCDALIHLAAIRSPMNHPDTVVYADNTVSSYNALSAAATLGIRRVCLASSINAIGGVFSHSPRYDYFPLDERHPTYAEDPYSLSKWVLEQQADAFVRRFPTLTVASLRFHWLLESFEAACTRTPDLGEAAEKHLWAYTALPEASRACLLSLTADFSGHEVFYIVGPRTVRQTPSLDLARRYYPETPIRGDLSGNRSFFDCAKAERLLGWVHQSP